MKRESLDNPIWKWIAYRLPEPVLYWAMIRIGSTRIKGGEIVPEVSFMDVLQRVGS